MNILHYALGFPPYRSGGLTKFCVDLMVQQSQEGHDVAMLWPGKMNIFNKKTLIKKHQDVVIKNENIQNFEIVNPLPVSYDEGILEFSAFTKTTDKNVYEHIIDVFQPNIIHVHTLMGLHKSFLEVAKRKKIRLIFTAHDFFPICSKVTLFHNGSICNSVQTCEECGKCNVTALSLKKIHILQSPIYRAVKDMLIIKKIRKRHRDTYLNGATAEKFIGSVGISDDYKKLREYYYYLLKLMDIIHYNSSITKKVYESVFDLQNSCIISITHSDITDRRKKKYFSDDILRIRYLGPNGEGKGYFLLKEALDELWNKKQKFCLDVHFTPIQMSPYINVHERYKYSDLENIFDETDVLVVPSIWYETFGFTVLEAISYGVPVIISGTVGAKDILVEGAGIIIDNINEKKLYEVFQDLCPDKLKQMNQVIVEKQSIVQIEGMSKQIEKICYEWE